MGRYAADVDTLSAKIRKAIVKRFKLEHVDFDELKVKNRKKSFAFSGFFFTTSIVAVTIVDPYSAALANSAYWYYPAENGETDEQIYGWKSTQTVSFSRGKFKVVTGQAAVELFVDIADMPDAGTAKAYAYDQVGKLGWGRDQYSCLVKLWERESNWRHTAMNKSSGAYGIPQALPGIKMASEGSDWLTNPETQIRWGLGYIKGRYSTPCGALAHSDRLGWY
ncbi:unannotated protein [freshwater metagenome]|jgi:hypothetical protein|uniref:Unannotated protein n=2 Tax=freshwater metagenome TaxID=449393 RepID=A0A6J6I0V7_9ZZZZ